MRADHWFQLAMIGIGLLYFIGGASVQSSVWMAASCVYGAAS